MTRTATHRIVNAPYASMIGMVGRIAMRGSEDAEAGATFVITDERYLAQYPGCVGIGVNIPLFPLGGPALEEVA